MPSKDARRAVMIAKKVGGPVAEPTEAQIEAGNYKKGHVKFQGLDIAIENAKGSTRRGIGEDEKPWECVLPADYGYIKRTEGADGDHVDCYVGPNKDSQQVFIINQNDHKTGKFDEHKCMIGFSSEAEAARKPGASFHARLQGMAEDRQDKNAGRVG